MRVPHGTLWLVHMSFFHWSTCLPHSCMDLPPHHRVICHLYLPHHRTYAMSFVQMTRGTFLLIHMGPKKCHFWVTCGILSCCHITMLTSTWIHLSFVWSVLTGHVASHGLGTWHPCFDFWPSLTKLWLATTFVYELHLRWFLCHWKSLTKLYIMKSFCKRIWENHFLSILDPLGSFFSVPDSPRSVMKIEKSKIRSYT